MRVLLVFAYCAAAAASQLTEWETVRPMHVPAVEAYTRFHGPKESAGGGRIVGGAEVTPHSIPHQAALLITSPDGQLFCGATLIAPQYVLTAAHCAEPGSSFTVVLGAHNITARDETAQLRVETTHKVVHPGWNAMSLEHDIALLRLPDPVQYTDAIRPARLPSLADSRLVLNGVDAVMSGWGKPSDASPSISPVLRAVTKPVVPRQVCNLAYGGVVTDNQICTSGSRGQSTCNGDSGGPLTIALHDDARPTLVGVVSFGIRLGCEVNWPPVFTRVTSYLQWIAGQTGTEVTPDASLTRVTSV